MNKGHEVFTRWGLIIAAMGMAVGTGNVWRFPRIFAINEGGAFLIPWLIFLFAWSIPLLILEVGMGKKARKGVVGAFASLIGPRYTWMGGFVALVTVCIMFYYSVVTGWCLRYFSAALTGELANLTDPEIAQQAFQTFASSGWALFFHLCAIGCASWVIYRGVTRGIERINKILIPMLALLLIIAALRAVTLPGAERGLQFMFHIHWASLADYNLWIEALTQSAWSTGAGMGLLLTYAVYAREQEDSVRNSLIIGLGNNSMSIIAGLAIIPTVFAAFPTFEEGFAVATYSGPASTGLTFIWISILFGQIPFGNLFTVIFFLALSAAALSSLIALIELATRICMDFGFSRRKAVAAVASIAFLGGLPSALSLDFLANQDWVWGLGLMLSGGMLAFAAIKYGLDGVRRDLINLPGNELNLGSWFNIVLGMLVPLELLIMLSWWIVQSFEFAERWYDPFSTFSLGTCLLQWGLAAVLLLLLNDRMNQWILRGERSRSID